MLLETHISTLPPFGGTPLMVPIDNDRGASNDNAAMLKRANLRRISDVITRFRNLSPTMPVAEVQMFLAVALNEGASLTDLSALLDMKKSTASRYLLNLSDKTRTGSEGYGLVTREADPSELRRNMYGLTAKGRKIIDSLLS